MGKVYAFDKDDVSFLAKRKSLGKSKAAATRQIALLYAAARQAGGYDDGGTSIDAVREVVEQMGAYDVKNFATYVGSIDGTKVTKAKPGEPRELKVYQPGFEAAGDLVVELGSTS